MMGSKCKDVLVINRALLVCLIVLFECHVQSIVYGQQIGNGNSGHGLLRRQTDNSHMREHMPIVTKRYNQPFRFDRKVWNFDVDRWNHTFSNRVSFAMFSHDYNRQFGRALVLNVTAAAQAMHGTLNRQHQLHLHGASRLTSVNYFPANYSDACLTFSYLWNGFGRKTLKLLQRSAETVCIYADEVVSNDGREIGNGQWKDVQIQLNLGYGDSQFVLEFEFEASNFKSRYEQQFPEYNRLGFIAIRDFSIGYGECQYSVANECDSID
ncbi:hypothetical protein RDWZM_008380 [Blomia tropicalis]|uniref:MAM domain-containing protein n=1 Tax=Blomia tropicalis TaxID=40697 RepID=A0A9Q0RIT5_BLOTA|nr:hypothetical protein RDWZM_008380 [Blomia tropicalis]